MDLTIKKCKPCEGGVPKLTPSEIEKLSKSIDTEWQIVENRLLTKKMQFINFRHTMDYTNRIARLAEEEGHHPVLHISYSSLVIELYTYAINGLSENDFILAAKIDMLSTGYNNQC